MGSKKIDIYNYFEYRDFLRDIFNEYKKTHRDFNYRSFSRDAGIKDQTYLNRVINGKRNLTANYITNICSFFRLTPSQERYFETLVAFSYSKDPDQKEVLLKKILSLRYSKDIYRIEDKKLHFYQKWYYPVIRELATIVDFQDDFNLLARLCKPRITAVQARGAVNYLLKNDFIIKNPDGTHCQTHQVISTGPEVDSTILRKYYHQVMKHYSDAIDTEKRAHREISSLTMSVSEDVFLGIKKEIQDFRKRLLAMAKEDKRSPERVCLVGFHLIPRSESVNKKGEGE